MRHHRLLIALLLGWVVVASTGCGIQRRQGRTLQPLLSHDRQTDLVRPVIHTSRDSQ